MTEDEKYLHNHFLISIKSGLQPLEDIIEEALEIIEEESLESVISEEWLKKSINEESKKHIEGSKSWKKPTDCERLLTAFEKLREQKIVALHNAGYTISEAIYDIQSLWQDLEDENVQPIGYCYYHGQDLERVIEDGELNIGFYGSKENNDKEAIGIGHAICKVLQDEGFEVTWDGTTKKRILIDNFEWNNLYIDEEDAQKWDYEVCFEQMTK